MIWLQIFLAIATLYLLAGLLVAIVRASGHGMTWGVFVFTILLWPSLWL